MADLMSATAKYKELTNKYGNFVTPAMKIKYNGSDLCDTLDLKVVDLTVTLSLDNASMAVIKIGDAYTVKSHSFDSKLKSNFKLGNIMEIELGYFSSTTAIFKGYVAGVGMEMDKSPLFVVKLMDARKLMMTQGVKRQLYDDKNYSDVFKKVMGDYSKLCSIECDDTTDNLTAPISQSTNDYNFVRNELIRRGKSEREFFILYNKVYFREPQKNKTPIMTVRYNRELLKFSMMADYLNTKIEVIGYDRANCKSIVSKQDAKTTESFSAVISPAPSQFFIDSDVDSEAKAKTRAQAIAHRQQDEVCFAEGEMIGLPEIVPGRYIEVEDLDSLADKKYYICEVTHYINDSGFTTTFEAKGWQ